MAKQSSIIKIEGTIDDLTFYKSKDGYRIRKKTGVAADRIERDPQFQRTRENGKEFGHVAQMGKLMRRAIIDLLAEVRDDTLVPRMVRRLSKIKNLDSTSVRGDRQVAIGLQTDEENLLRGFDFNREAPLQQVLRKDIELDTATGVMTLANFDPTKHLAYPQGTTHVGFRAGFLNINLETEEAELQVSPEVDTAINAAPASITLTPDAVPAGDGNQVHLLLVEFYQEMNGAMYPLNTGAFNALSVVEVV